MIREATADDFDRLMTMAFRFLSSTTYGRLLRGVTEQSMATFIALVQARGVILVCEVGGGVVGMLGLVDVAHPMSGEREACEVAWWMEPEFRRGRHAYQLLCAAEDWATRQGLGCLKMVAPAGSHIGTFYERAGFTAVETTWQKFLGPQLITGTVQ